MWEILHRSTEKQCPSYFRPLLPLNGSDLMLLILLGNVKPFTSKQKKKKTRPKPSKVTVFLVPVGSRCVPRGKHRKNLIDKKCMVKIEVFRDWSGEKVKETILKAFEHLELPSFVYMSVDVSHKLWKDPEQSKDGSVLADLGRHGSIYIEKQLDVS